MRIDVPSTAAAARSSVVIALAVGLVLAMTGALAVAYRRGERARRVAPAVVPDAAIQALQSRLPGLPAMKHMTQLLREREGVTQALAHAPGVASQ